MLLRGYTIYDCKALQYHSPWWAASDGAAVRSFQDLVNDVNTTIGRHPGDYSLWFIGTYDDNKGIVHSQVPLTHIIDAAALVAVQPALPFDPTDAERQRAAVAERDQRIAAARTTAEVEAVLRNGRA